MFISNPFFYSVFDTKETFCTDVGRSGSKFPYQKMKKKYNIYIGQFILLFVCFLSGRYRADVFLSRENVCVGGGDPTLPPPPPPPPPPNPLKNREISEKMEEYQFILKWRQQQKMPPSPSHYYVALYYDKAFLP